MVPEARIRESEHGLVPEGEGWYVLNARDARWREREGLGRWCFLEAEPIPEIFTELGFQLFVVEPGQPACMYHRETITEDFLVVAGDCMLVIEEQERPLRAWDFVHCPPGTNHVIVGGESRAVVVAMSPRRDDSEIVYPVSEVAARHDASVEAETPKPQEAYARFARSVGRYREGDLPG